jgi:hypothetical protein
MRSDFFVVKDPDAASERFAILWRDTIPIGPQLWSLAEMRRVFLALFRSLTFVSEPQIRADLANLGLSADDIEDQIDRARRMVTSWDQTTWEQTTRVGYRNQHAQEVIRKTTADGTVPGQRIFVLRCSECGCVYGTNGCDIHLRRCPSCQDGPSGLSTCEETPTRH